jgi:glycine cleavage system H lipoate-binding protein
MDSSTPSNQRRALSQAEQRCVWMSAGVLSYQLCERGFDCEHCPLDAALRTRFARPAVDTPTDAERPLQPGHRPRLPADRLYSRGHTWVKAMRKSSDGRRTVACVGLEPGLAAALLTPKTVVLPTVWDRLERRHHHAWVVMDGGTLPIEAPTDGAVTAVHHELAAEPERLTRAPLGEGWLLEMELTDKELKSGRLMTPEEAEREYASEEVRFQSLLARALGGAGAAADSPAGPTLPDGGVPLQSVSEMLGPTRYFALLMQAFA